MTFQVLFPRSKYSVRPSGEKVGAPSLAGPEMTPGSKIAGAGSVACCADADPLANIEIVTMSESQCVPTPRPSIL